MNQYIRLFEFHMNSYTSKYTFIFRINCLKVIMKVRKYYESNYLWMTLEAEKNYFFLFQHDVA